MLNTELNDANAELLQAARVLIAGAVRMRRNLRPPINWLDEYKVDLAYIQRLARAVERVQEAKTNGSA